MTYKVIDNFLPESALKSIRPSAGFSPFKSKWYDVPKLPHQVEILKAAAGFAKFDKYEGFEEWSHNPHWLPLPDSHYDKNEELFQETGELSFPLCSCIFYLKVEDLVGADLFLEDIDELIVPRTNRLVLMQPGLLHKVTEYVSGTRVSININPWANAQKRS